MKRDRAAASELKRLRINRGLSPEQLGHLANVSGHTIRRIERTGCIPGPRVQFCLGAQLGHLPSDIWHLPGAPFGATPEAPARLEAA